MADFIQISGLSTKPAPLALTDKFALDDKDNKSYKGTGQQIIDFVNANASFQPLSAILSAMTMNAQRTYYASANGSNSNNGTEHNAFADPFYGSNNATGSQTIPAIVNGTIGNYSTSSFSIRPNIFLSGMLNTVRNATAGYVWNVNSNITLHSEWNTAAANSAFYMQNIKWSPTTFFDLNFSTATNGVYFVSKNCAFYGMVVTGAASHVPNILLEDTRDLGYGVGFLQANAVVRNSKLSNLSHTCVASAGATTLAIENSTIDTTLFLQGNSGGATLTATVSNTRVGTSITLSGTQVTLIIDAASVPQGGITYSNGATSAQVNPTSPASAVYATSSRSNYTPTSATVEGNLAGIDAALGAQPAQNVNPNIIIGGNFDTNPFQRGALFNPASTNTFVADRFKYVFSGSGQVEWLQNNSNPAPVNLAGFKTSNVLQMNVQTADASIGATDIYRLSYGVEGPDWERVAGITSTLSFLVCATVTGTYCVAIANSANTRIFIAEYTVTASNTWQKITINISDTASTGTWDYTVGGLGAQITWCIAGGSNFQGSTGWNTVAGARYCTSNQANGLSANSNIFALDNIKLEPGSTATAYPQELIKDVLARTQRYYQKSYNPNVAPGTATNVGMISNLSAATTGALGKDTRFKVDMAYTPTVQTYDGAGAAGKVYRGADGANATIDFQGTSGVRIYSATGSSAATFQCHYVADAELI